MMALSAKSRITIGLICLQLSVICTAMMMGLVPERKSALLAGRAQLCETIAVASSDYISRGQIKRLEFLLNSIVQRNDGLLSAGIRRPSGRLIVEIGPHHQLWGERSSERSGERSTDDKIQVPIRSGEDAWGTVELKYEPLASTGVIGWLRQPWVMMTAFICASCYVLFFVYLKRMLAYLDPSKAVPKRVRAALDSLAEGLLVLDKEHRIVLANQSFATWVNRPAERLIGANVDKLDWVTQGETGNEPQYPWGVALEMETAQAGAMIGLRNSDDSVRNLMTNASPVLGHDGHYRGVLVSFDDVTQLEATRKDLRVAKKAAEDANQAKSAFLARMSHEIRTPMNAILGYTDVLRRGFDRSRQDRQEYLNTIHASGEHLLALINDILDLSKIESGRMELEVTHCSIHRLLAHVTSVLKVKAEEKGIGLELEFEGKLPESIETDEVRLKQTVMNLVGNAIKFTSQGGVRIVARMAGKDDLQWLAQRKNTKPSMPRAASELMAVDCIDTGIGISRQALENIFNPFAQADTSITRRFGGTGLGLAISRQLTESMKGGIRVTSEMGKGSTFTILFDVGNLDGVPRVDSDQALSSTGSEAGQHGSTLQLPPADVLVADDGDSNRKLVSLVLTRAGVRVVAVDDGKQAVDRALAESFDVILMDMQMPVMDGYEATRTLRKAGVTQPIIALTAHAMQGDEQKCRSAGCSGFLTKPIDIDHLLATLAEVLGTRPSECPTIDVDASQDDDGDGNTLDELNELGHFLGQASKDRKCDTDALPARGEESDEGPVALTCAYPLDDPDFLEIAEDFVRRLDEQLTAMREASRGGDLEELARLAHWVKGSGGTAGYDDFTEPAYELETAAKCHKIDAIDAHIKRLSDLASRIDLKLELATDSSAATKASRSTSGLP